MSTFADSSALVELYSGQPGHEHVRGLVRVAVAQLARVEVPAALWRKQRRGELSADDGRLLTADFEADLRCRCVLTTVTDLLQATRADAAYQIYACVAQLRIERTPRRHPRKGIEWLSD